MTRRRARCSLAWLLLPLLLGAGCALPKEKLSAPPAAKAEARPGGVLVVGITAPAGVDPLSYHEPSGLLIGSVLCDTLVTVDPETGEIKPGLAQKWTVTDDGGRIIFQLRKDVFFHDGREVRSADVTDSLERLAHPEYASYSAGLVNSVLGLPRFIADAEEGLPSPSLNGARVIEPYSFELLLDSKNPDILRALAHPATAPLSKAPYDKDTVSAPAFPQCAGPYRLESPYAPGSPEIVLKRFERYHGLNTGFTTGGLGYADEVRFRVFPDEGAVFQAYERGEVDVAGVPSTRVAEARQRHGERVVFGDIPYEEFIALPHGEHSPFGDKDLRIALSRALDRQALVKEVYGDAHRPATGFIPPALTTEPSRRIGKGAVRRIEYGCGSTVPLTPDPEGARRLWEAAKVKLTAAAQAPAPAPTQAGLPGVSGRAAPAGGPLKIYFNDESTHRKLVETVAAQWRAALGVEFEAVPLNWDAYVQTATTGTGFDGAFRLSHAPRYSSPLAFLGPLFMSGNVHANPARYTSAAFDTALIEDTRAEVDEDERLLRYRELEDLLCNDVPIIPVAFGQRAVAVGPRVLAARSSGRILTRDGVPMLRDLAVIQ